MALQNLLHVPHQRLMAEPEVQLQRHMRSNQLGRGILNKGKSQLNPIHPLTFSCSMCFLCCLIRLTS